MAAANDNRQQDRTAHVARELTCPDCGQKGGVTLAQSAARPRIINLSTGFHVEEGRTQSGEALVICDRCDAILAC
jgi:hypothetical protein